MRRFLGLLTLLLLPAVPAFAQQAPPVPVAAQQAPPTQVGRVSFVQGQLAFHMPGETQWSAASLNYPVAPGASFWTAPQARAEFRFGPHTVDLSGNTGLDIAKLDEHAIQLALREGRINLHLRDLAQGDTAEIDIPRGKVTLLEPGIYDIDAGTEERPARIAVFEGSAKFAGGGADTAIKAGNAAVISGTGTTLMASLERAMPDEFAEWCRDRDKQVPAVAAAAKRVSPRMTGYEELGSYGTWRSAPDYGEVWYPNDVPSGWAPYRDGNWAWVEPWGWTWVDEQPWGFAPSHYGRWAYLDNAWGWVPPPIGPAPVYAPALVAFLDSPAGLLASRARGPVVGWFPLGPGEAYWPGYTRDPAYIQAVNAGIVRDAARLDRAVANAAAANRAAATIVPQSAFANGRRIGPAALRASGASLQRAAAAAQPLSVRPGKHARGAAVKMPRAAAASAARAFAGGGGHSARGGGHVARGGDGHGGRHVARGGGGHRRGHVARDGRGHGSKHFARGGGGHGSKHFPRGGGHGGGHFARGGGGHGGMHIGGGGPPGGMAHFGAGGGGKHGGRHGGGHGGGGHGGGGHGGGGKHGGGKGH